MAARNYIDPDRSWDWLEQIKIGDILLENGKSERIVRAVHMKKSGMLYGVSFVIQRCSWTGRCHTTVSRSDLKTRKFANPGKSKSEADLVDKLIAHDLLYWQKDKQRLDCCDVKGIR